MSKEGLSELNSLKGIRPWQFIAATFRYCKGPGFNKLGFTRTIRDEFNTKVQIIHWDGINLNLGKIL